MQTRQSAVVLLALCTALLLTAPTVSAQLAEEAESSDKYEPPPREEYADKDIQDSTKPAAEEVSDKIDKSLNRLEEAIDYAKELGEKLKPGGDISNRELKGHNEIARKNELDENDGHHPTSRAWDEYTRDSRFLLKDPTFVPCIEWREVTEEENPDYYAACEFNCPSCVDPENYKGGWDWDPAVHPQNCECTPQSSKCIQQKKIVIEFYWPKRTYAMNKAGARSLDPTMFGGGQDRQDWLRSQLAQLHEQMVVPVLLTWLVPKGIDTSLWENPEWRQPGDEFHYQMHEGPFGGVGDAQKFVRAYRTNLDFRATDDKPRQKWWHGWAQNPKSLLWALGEGTIERKILSQTNEQGALYFLSMLPEFQDLWGVIENPDYDAVIKMDQIMEVAKDDRAAFEELGPSYRMQRDRDDFQVFGGLERIFVQANQTARQPDIVMVRPGGGGSEFYLHMNDHTFSDELRADAARAAKLAALLGFNQKLPAPHDQEELRHYIFSLYKNRESKPGYVGPWDSLEKGPFQKIIYTDKMQRVFPPVDDGSEERGTYCFRPENIPNHETDVDDSEWDQFDQKFEQYGESRYVTWEKMVLCACEHCGKWRGAVLLNDGDYRENTFEGKNPLTSPPDVFAAAMPHLHEYADMRTPPQSFPPICDDWKRCVEELEEYDRGEPGVMTGSGDANYVKPPEIMCPIPGGGLIGGDPTGGLIAGPTAPGGGLFPDLPPGTVIPITPDITGGLTGGGGVFTGGGLTGGIVGGGLAGGGLVGGGLAGGGLVGGGLVGGGIVGGGIVGGGGFPGNLIPQVPGGGTFGGGNFGGITAGNLGGNLGGFGGGNFGGVGLFRKQERSNEESRTPEQEKPFGNLFD